MFSRFTQYWILLCSGLAMAGWLLSFFGMLHRTGYLIFFGGFAAVLLLVRRTLEIPAISWRAEWKKFARRFRRLPPLLFLVMVVLNLLAGFLYEPMHGDSQCYRVPRILHWLWNEQWHWIHTADVRLNVTAPGIDWLWAPGFLFLPGQRWMFLVNTISFALLPGMLFALFRLAGVRGRTAWWWMWIVPAGYGYVLQAGGLASDSYATPFALAAVVFAFRAFHTKRVGDLWISMLAAALMTGAKQTNLLLIPLWFVPFVMNWRVLLKRPVLTMGVALVALAASCVPISMINLKLAGSWQGFTGADAARITPRYPLWGIIGNTFALPVQNLLPPVFPLAPEWNDAMRQFLATSWGEKFEGFEKFGQVYRAPSETTGGLGLAVTGLLIWGLLGGRKGADRKAPIRRNTLLYYTYYWGPWFLLLFFMAKVGVDTNSRYLAPMFPFLILPVLARAGAQYRSWLWRGAAYGAMLIALLLVVTARPRPVFPVQTICKIGQKLLPESAIFPKVQRSYSYFQEGDVVGKGIAAALPRDGSAVGYAVDVGFLEVYLWLPFGSRPVHRLLVSDGRQEVEAWQLKYVLVDELVLGIQGFTTMDEWTAKYGGKIVQTWHLRRLGPEAPAEKFHLVRMEPKTEHVPEPPLQMSLHTE